MTLRYAMMAAGCSAQEAAAITGIPTAVTTSAAAGGAPTGNSQATAAAPPSDAVYLTGSSVGSSTGYKLPSGVDATPTPGTVGLGDVYEFHNQGGNTLSVYPNTTTGKIQGGSAGAAFSIANNKVAWITYLGSDLWSAVLSA